MARRTPFTYTDCTLVASSHDAVISCQVLLEMTPGPASSDVSLVPEVHPKAQRAIKLALAEPECLGARGAVGLEIMFRQSKRNVFRFHPEGERKTAGQREVAVDVSEVVACRLKRVVDLAAAPGGRAAKRAVLQANRIERGGAAGFIRLPSCSRSAGAALDGIRKSDKRPRTEHQRSNDVDSNGAKQIGQSSCVISRGDETNNGCHEYDTSGARCG